MKERETRGKGRIRTDVVRPLQFYGQVRAPGPVALHGVHGGDGGEVLQEDDGPRGSQVRGVVDHCGHDQTPRGREPHVRAPTPAGHLCRRRNGEACW